jgi:hypothetical protein
VRVERVALVHLDGGRIGEHLPQRRQVESAELGVLPDPVTLPAVLLGRGCAWWNGDDVGGGGVEQILVPALGGRVLPLPIQVVGDQERDVKEDLAEVGPHAAATEVHRVAADPVIDDGLEVAPGWALPECLLTVGCEQPVDATSEQLSLHPLTEGGAEPFGHVQRAGTGRTLQVEQIPVEVNNRIADRAEHDGDVR